MKQKYILIALISLIVSTLHILPAPLAGLSYDWNRPASKNSTRYGLSFKNKSNQDLFLVIENGSLAKTEAKFGSLLFFNNKQGFPIAMTPVFKAGSASKTGQYWEGVNIDMDINQPTVLSIYTYDRKQGIMNLPKTTILNNEEIGRSFLPGSQLLYRTAFTPGRTLYIKWDGKKLTPQEGNILGKTDGGFSTKINVKQNDITPIR